MNKRDTFPFEMDRAVIDSFLAGAKHAPQSDYLSTAEGKLLFQGHVIAWYDSGGSLVSFAVSAALYGGHIVHYMLDALGVEARIEREIIQARVPSGPSTIKYFFDGQEVMPGAPITLAGPLSVQAHRATRKKSHIVPLPE